LGLGSALAIGQQATSVVAKASDSHETVTPSHRITSGAPFTDSDLDHRAESRVCLSMRTYSFSTPSSPAAAPKPIGVTDCVAISKHQMKNVSSGEPKLVP